MFGILDRYIGRTIFGTIAITLFMLVSLSTIIRFIDQLRQVKLNYTALSAAWYSVLMVPKDLEIFFPMAALLGGLIGLGILASRSELVVMETGGFSRLKIAKAVMKTAIPLVLLTMAISEWVAPYGEQTARAMRIEKRYGSSMIATQNSVWAKDGDNFIHIGTVNNDNTLNNVDIYSIKDNELVRLTHADYAEYLNNEWVLRQVEVSDLSDPKQVVGYNRINQVWQTNITPQRLGIVALDPDSLSTSGLYHYARYLQSTGQDASNYQLSFWRKVFKPLSVAVMLLMSLSFIFGPLRSVSMGARVLTGIAFGFVFYVADTLFSKLSIKMGFYPIIGALLTSIIFLGLSLFLLNRKR